MKGPEFVEVLRTALLSVSGYQTLPAGTFPTLPTLEATEFGQQHIITTFFLDLPPPALLMNQGGFGPAVTLHVILPEGYSYWQPETGTALYLGGVQKIEQLPEVYRQIIEAHTLRLAVRTGDIYSPAHINRYLHLLARVASNEWLLNNNPNLVEERAVALKVERYLNRFCESELSAYYHSRGRALRKWIEQATYEKNWVEKAEDIISTTAPDWVGIDDTKTLELHSAEPVPAILDGRQCIVVLFYKTFEEQAQPLKPMHPHPPFAGCYISYPDMEVRWRRFNQDDYIGSFYLPHDELDKLTQPSQDQVEEKRRTYRQMISVLLERKWLLTSYPATSEEIAAAKVLRECIQVLSTPTTVASHAHIACQLWGWIRRVERGSK